MMCFYKPPFHSSHPPSQEFEIKVDLIPTELPPQISSIISEAPSSLLKFLQDMQQTLFKNLPKWRELLKTFTKGLSSGQQMVANTLIDQFFEPISKMMERFDPYLKHAEVNGFSSSLDNWIPPEVFLILPALKRKVKNGNASPIEMVIVSFLKDLRARFFPKEKDSQQKEQTLLPIQCDIPEVSPRDIEKEMELLFQALPELRDPNWISNAGFSSLASMTLKSKLSATEPAELAKQLAHYVDPQSWKQIKDCLEIIRSQRIMPNSSRLLGEKGVRLEENPWGHALSAILSSPRVYFKPEAIMMMKWAGLSNMIQIWRLAQEVRRSEDPSLKNVNSNQHPQLEAAMENLADQQLKTVEFEESSVTDIHHVTGIKSATFGYQSLTARPQDVTEALKKQLKGTVLYLEGINLSQTLVQSSHPARALDSLRKFAVNQSNKLKITYYTDYEPEPTVLLPRVQNLLQKIAESGSLPSDLPTRSSEGTWYKLSEWMQVEIVQYFGNSMVETP